MMGLGELLILLSAGGILAAIVVFFVGVGRAKQAALRDQGPIPTAPPKRAAALRSEAAGHQVVDLRPGIEISAQLREAAAAAELRGLRPFLEVGANWCPPSRMFGEFLTDPQMQAALAGICLIRAEQDHFPSDPTLLALKVMSVPIFFELNAEGESTGRQITGGAWGEDTIENMSRTMASFFAG